MKQTTKTTLNGAYVPNIGLVDLNPAAGLVTKFIQDYDIVEERHVYDSKGKPVGKEVQVMQEPLINTQETFISFFNDRLEMMLSAPVLYKIGKAGVHGDLVGSIRKSFESLPLVTSTSCLGKANSLYGKIVHNKGSNVVNPTETPVIIPSYSHDSLDQVLRTEQGLTFNRALFDTKDNAEDIAETLERLTRYKRKEIVFYTSSQKDRKENPELVVRFHPTSCAEEYVHDKAWFFIGNFATAGDWYGGCTKFDSGTSRGIKPHEQ